MLWVSGSTVVNFGDEFTKRHALGYSGPNSRPADASERTMPICERTSFKLASPWLDPQAWGEIVLRATGYLILSVFTPKWGLGIQSRSRSQVNPKSQWFPSPSPIDGGTSLHDLAIGWVCACWPKREKCLAGFIPRCGMGGAMPTRPWPAGVRVSALAALS